MEENKNLQTNEENVDQVIAEDEVSASTPPVKPTKKKSKAKIVILVIIGLLVIAGLVVGGIILFGHKHEFAEATCTSPKTCECGATEGEPKGHSWKDATCTSPKVCDLCDKSEGEAKGHDWKSASCMAPKTCKNCSKTEGSKTSHSTKVGVCSYCNEAQGYDTVYWIYDYIVKASDFHTQGSECIDPDETSLYVIHFNLTMADIYYESSIEYFKKAYDLCGNHSHLNRLKSALYDVAFHKFPELDTNWNSLLNWLDSDTEFSYNAYEATQELQKVFEIYD